MNRHPSTPPEIESKCYLTELTDRVIPFWDGHCPDNECGGFFNCLDRDGSVYDTEKHMWMQWRIVYMFAELSTAEFGQTRWKALAGSGFEFLRKHGKAPDGSYYFALNREGVPSAAPHSIYSDCFAAKASAVL